MTAMEKALERIEEETMKNKGEVGFNAALVYQIDAISILEQFEIDLLKELEEEKLKQEYANK